jgi:hypothetical protein
VVFDEDSFPLVASPNLTDLDFLLESSSTVSTIGTRLPLQVLPSRRFASLPRWFPRASPLPALAIALGFLPRAASTTPAAPHVAQASPGAATTTPTTPRAAPESPAVPHAAAAPHAATDGPPPREWPSSPIVYTKRPWQPAPSAPMGSASTPPN